MTDKSTEEQRHEAFYNKPLGMTPQGIKIDQEAKMGNVVEYIAHQLFHIRKALEKIAEHK